MTGTRVAALVMIPLAIVVGLLGGRYWHVTHSPRPQVATLTQRPITAAPTPGPSSDTGPSPAKPAPEVAAHDPAPAIGTLPQTDATGPAAKPPTTSPAPDGISPSFDVVRVEPQGDAVVAGKGAPNAKVALLSGGKVVGEATSDANGQFVILPQRLTPGDHALTLRQTPEGAPARESTQSVAVSVPQPGQDRGRVVVAVAEPGRATRLLSPPPGATGAAAAPVGKVIIRSAELENGSGVYVSGAAQAGTSVHVYLNDSHIADVVAGADGAWSVRVKHGLTGGHYSVRADAAGSSGKVIARAEVPFDVPVPMARAGTPQVAPAVLASAAPGMPTPANDAPKAGTAPPSGMAAAPDAASSDAAGPARGARGPVASGDAEATIESIVTARVTRGDNLWNISRFRLGDGLRYTQIYAANVDQIRDPNLIYPGQVFVVPNSR